MNKKLFLKLGLGLGVVAAISSVSVIAYNQKNNSAKEIEVSKSDADYLDLNTQDSMTENGDVVSSSFKNLTDSKSEKTQEKAQENVQEKDQENIQENVQENVQENIQEKDQENVQENVQEKDQEKTRQEELDKQHAELKTTQEKEVFYYNIINEAMQRQINYIKSIKDPKVSQSVQSSVGAAVGESTFLELKYPEDYKIIRESLQKVLNGK